MLAELRSWLAGRGLQRLAEHVAENLPGSLDAHSTKVEHALIGHDAKQWRAVRITVEAYLLDDHGHPVPETEPWPPT